MKRSPEAMEIGNVFSKYSKTGDKSLIEDISVEDIEFTMIQFKRDENTPFYKAMEMRLDELRERRQSREKWIDRLIGFIAGIIGSLVVWYITK